jgi:YD repeat-containing protein
MTKIYKYGTGNPGMGNLLIAQEGLSNSKQEINFDFGVLSNNGQQTTCMMACSGTRMIITGRPSFDLTTFNGSPVVYPEVTVYDSSTTMPNGKRKYKFNFVADQPVYAPKAYNNGKFQSNDSWKGGDENYNSVFTSTGIKIEDTYSSTAVYLPNNYAWGTKVGWKITREGCPYSYQPSVYNDYYYFDYTIYSGFKKLTNTRKRQYSLSDTVNYFETNANYYYEQLSHQHLQLTKKTLINSNITEGDTLVTKYWYPADYDSSYAVLHYIKYMLRNNIIALPIKEQNYRKNKITIGKNIVFNDYGNPIEIYSYETDVPKPAPVHIKSIPIPSGYVKRAILTYDANQNLVMVEKDDSIKTSYLWGYYKSLPVAQIENASYSQVLTVFGGAIPNLAGGGLSTSQINTLRNGLSKALISTFTYTPFFGMTSRTDPSSTSTSFEYDGLGRLKLIRDHDGRILKTYEYNYKP